MDIQATLLPTALATKATQAKLTQWLIGQILNATVTARPSNNTAILQINNQAVEAKINPDKPLIVGEQLKLIVEKKGEPTVLRVVQNDTPKIMTEIRQQLLRENLPKQSNMEKLTQVLSLLTNNTKNVVKAFPAPIERQLQKLIENLPTKSAVKNENELKTVIKNSGLFLEKKLALEVINKHESSQAKPTPTSAQTSQAPLLNKDLKANLLQTASLITKHKGESKAPETPNLKVSPDLLPIKKVAFSSEKVNVKNTIKYIDIAAKIDIETISKQIESSIARIEVNQSKAVVTNDNLNPNWSIEIPVKDKQGIDLLKLEIQADKDSKNKNDKNKSWAVSLKINFENLGSISARLSLFDNEVSATLWSENETMNSLINNNLSLLEKQISKTGLLAGKVECLAKAPNEDELEQETYSHVNKLINTSV